MSTYQLVKAGITPEIQGTKFVIIYATNVDEIIQDNVTVDALYDPHVVHYVRQLTFLVDMVWDRDKDNCMESIYDHSTLECKHFPGYKKTGEVKWYLKGEPFLPLFVGQVDFIKTAKTAEELAL